jgi:hypothetical protein
MFFCFVLWFQVPDYFQFIKHPMDLSTVNAKLQDGQYPNPMACVNDVRMIFRNCYLYNAVGTDAWNCAQNLSREFEKEIYNIIFNRA